MIYFPIKCGMKRNIKNQASDGRKVAGINIKTVRPIVKKERAGVKDPVRFPDVINGYENETNV